MRFKNIYKELISEATYYDPKYINGEKLFIDGKSVTGEMKQLANTTVQVIPPPKKNVKTIEILGTAKKPGFDKPTFVQTEDGLVYKLINVADKPFKVIKKNKAGKKLGYNTDITSVQESAVCHMLALGMKNKNKDFKSIIEYIDITSKEDIQKDLLSVQDKYDCDSDISNTIIMIKEEKRWKISIAATVAKLFSEFKFKSSSVFHRGTLDSQIKRHGAILAGVAKDDKWNPADIWVIKKGSKEVQKFLKADSLSVANDIINDNIGKGTYKEFFGISLKQTKNPAPLKYFNLEKKQGKKIAADVAQGGKVPKAGFTKTTTLIDSNDNIVIDFRSTSGSKASVISGKIKGKNAFGGSITINALLERNKTFLPNFSKDEKYYFRGKASTDKFYSDFQTQLNDAISNAKRIGIKKLDGFLFKIKTKKELDKYLENTFDSWKGRSDHVAVTMHAKLQGLYLLANISKSDFEWVYYQATAQTEINPVFVKVGE